MNNKPQKNSSLDTTKKSYVGTSYTRGATHLPSLECKRSSFTAITGMPGKFY